MADDLEQLFELFKNILLMMYRRGYNVSKFEKIFEGDFEYFQEKYNLDNIMNKPNTIQKILMDTYSKNNLRGLMSCILKKKDNSKEKCLVYFAELESTQSIGKPEIQNVESLMLEEKCVRSVIVCPVNLSPTGVTMISSNNKINIFFDTNILFDPSISKYSSKVDRIVYPENVSKFLGENKLTARQIPKISNNDIIAKYYDIPSGSLVRFLRRNMIAGTLLDENYYYRLVINKVIDKQKNKPKEKAIII